MCCGFLMAHRLRGANRIYQFPPWLLSVLRSDYITNDASVRLFFVLQLCQHSAVIIRNHQLTRSNVCLFNRNVNSKQRPSLTQFQLRPSLPQLAILLCVRSHSQRHWAPYVLIWHLFRSLRLLLLGREWYPLPRYLDSTSQMRPNVKLWWRVIVSYSF